MRRQAPLKNLGFFRVPKSGKRPRRAFSTGSEQAAHQVIRRRMRRQAPLKNLGFFRVPKSGKRPRRAFSTGN
jgi:ribosomal protein L34E